MRHILHITIAFHGPESDLTDMKPRSYSQFNNLTFDPPYVMFSANQDMHAARKYVRTKTKTLPIPCSLLSSTQRTQTSSLKP